MRRRSALIAAAALLALSGTAQAGAVQPTKARAQERAQEKARSRIQDARYLIISENPEVGELALAPGNGPADPPEFPIVGTHYDGEQWTVHPAGSGKYTINSTTHPDAAWSRQGEKILASAGSWSQFAIEPAGDGAYVIKSPNRDEVATLNSSRGDQLHVEHSNGSPSQRWRFERVG